MEPRALSVLTPIDPAAGGAPDWLVARRRAAADQAATAEPPSTDEEVWRYSRIGELDLDAFTPVDSDAAPDEAATVAGRTVLDRVRAAVGTVAGVVLVVDGRVATCELDPAVAAQGVVLGPLAAVDDDAVRLGLVAEPSDLFDLLSEAQTIEPVALVVPRSVAVEAPVVVVDHIAADGAAVFGRLLVVAGAASQVTIVEWQSSADVAALCTPVAEVAVGAGANVRHVVVQERGERVWQLGHLASRVERDGSYHSVQLALGGSYARSRADCRLAERGASARLDAASLGHRDQMLDFRTFQRHEAPDTTSNLLFTGALAGAARSVYTGLIRVEAAARGTNAFQTNRNLKLSDDAWAESVPNLEIENNDVRCSHASTVAPVDPDQRFYLESRGVPPAEAERLLAMGFFGEVLDAVPVPAVAALVREEIAARIVAAVRPDTAGGAS